MFSWKSHPRFILTLICAFWIVLTLGLYLLPFFPELELRTRDILERTSGSRQATRNPRLAFLGVDQETESLDRLLSGELEQSRALQIIKGGKPWSRELYALIAEKLIQAGARVVVFDIRFPGPREGDEAFHRVLEKYPGQIVIGCNFIDLPDDLGEGKVSSRKALELPPPSLLPGGGI